MRIAQGMSHGVAMAINDLLDNVAQVKPGNEVLIVACLDGLYGGDNLVDETAISWIQSAIHQRGANASVLWIDEPDKPHAWRFSPILKAAMAGCDTIINHSFDLTIEDIQPFADRLEELGIRYVRNFATTSALLNTAWAQTPWELVSEIRYQALTVFEEGLPWELKDENGTHLNGKIGAPHIEHPKGFAVRRGEGFFFPYFPWPEWVFTPIALEETSGEFIFDCMLSWWSRYAGIPPFFSEPIHLTIENGRIKKIEGGDEAKALIRFLEIMKEKVGDNVYDFNTMHSGVHPQARVGAHQCPSLNYRRLIEHTHTSNIHAHIGSMYRENPDYPYWPHLTGDIRTASWRVGDTFVHKNGRLMALEHPEVLKVAAKYPDRPGLTPEPWRY